VTDVAVIIESIINQETENHPESHLFRDPVIGYASADDPLYDQLSEIIGNRQLHPKDIVTDARTVIVYFIPASLPVISQIKGSNNIVQIWSDHYSAANQLLQTIGEQLVRMLRINGFTSAMEPPTNHYDPVQLTAQWAHKSSAVIAGIGTFGLSQLLITRAGTAGRLGSVVTDARIPATRRPATSFCLYYQSKKCQKCVDRCPSGALTTSGFDRFRCNAYLDGKNIHDSQQGCGMCSSGPCAATGFEDESLKRGVHHQQVYRQRT
jgi:epoxyqueuosine reductase QueG